jgi:hypothetical protein
MHKTVPHQQFRNCFWYQRRSLIKSNGFRHGLARTPDGKKYLEFTYSISEQDLDSMAFLLRVSIYVCVGTLIRHKFNF